MAKNLSYKRTTTEKISIKGILNEDATEITYTDGEIERTVAIKDYLNRFAGGYIEVSLQNKSEQDLEYTLINDEEDIDAAEI